VRTSPRRTSARRARKYHPRLSDDQQCQQSRFAACLTGHRRRDVCVIWARSWRSRPSTSNEPLVGMRATLWHTCLRKHQRLSPRNTGVKDAPGIAEHTARPPISPTLQREISQLVKEHVSINQIANRLRIGYGTAHKYVQRRNGVQKK
jgi:hypothetical protein